MKKTFKVAAAALTMAAGLAATSANAVQITWGNITGFTNGDTTVTYDFGGLGSVNLMIDAITAGVSVNSQTLPTNGAGVDSENHAGFTNVTGDVLFMAAGNNFRHQINFTWDFANYLGLPGSLVFDIGALAGNGDRGGTDVNILAPANLLSDINSTGVFGAQVAGQDVTIDVIGSAPSDGDFLFGGFAIDTPLTSEFIIGRNDGFTIGLGSIPVPAPASALLLAAGLVLVRRRKAA